MSPRLLRTFATAAACGVVAAAAGADVLVELGNGDAVSGSFLPAAETETFLFAVPAGARLTVVAQGTAKPGRKAPKVALALLDADGADLTAGAGVLQPLAHGAKVQGLRVTGSGVHTARVTSDATGAYSFRASWKPATRPPRTPVVFATTGEETTVGFSADAGATATVTIAAAQSASRPRLVRIASRDGSWTTDDFAPPANASAAAHTVRGVKLGGPAGDYDVVVRESGAAPGAALVTVVLTPPKAAPRKVDVTTQQTGRSATSNAALGGPVGRAGGRVEAAADELAPVHGAAIEVPAGALTKPAVLVVSTSDPLRVASKEPRGPAVAIGPRGLAFRRPGGGAPTLVTIPFDAESFGGSLSSLAVHVREAGGGVRRVEPQSAYVVDAHAGTVTFPVTRSGTFQAFGPAAPRRADLDDDGYDDLVVPAPHAAGGVGQVHVWFGRADFATRKPSAPDVTIPGPPADRGFGKWTAVGDVNGDGVADLAVSGRNEESAVSGRVHVWFGGAGFPRSATDALSAADAVVTGAAASGDSFGRRMTIGDVTGDGTADLVIGASSTTVDLNLQGAVFVAPGGAAFASHASSDPEILRIRGSSLGQGFGRAVAAARLGTGAAPYLLVAADLSGAQALQGRVYLVPAGPALAEGVVAADAVRITGDAVGDRFGADVAALDVDLDGADDLVVGAPGVDVPGDTDEIVDTGVVYVFLGKFPFVDAFAPAADLRISAGAVQDEARGAYLATGRFTGGVPRDLAIGSHLRSDPPVIAGGAVRVLRSGPAFPGGEAFTPGTETAARFGRLFPGVDLNGDGRDEVVAAAPGAEGARGTVTVAFGPLGFAGTSVVLVGLEPGDQLGGE